MTSPFTPIPITFDGTNLQPTDLSFCFWIVSGLNETPEVRGVDVTVPALAGRIESNRMNDVLPLVLEGFVRADPSTTTTAAAQSSYRTKAKLIRALFASNRARANLVATLEDGTTATISARPLSGIIWKEEIPSEYATVSIELEGSGNWVVV